jgi:hypothetical protein
VSWRARGASGDSRPLLAQRARRAVPRRGRACQRSGAICAQTSARGSGEHRPYHAFCTPFQRHGSPQRAGQLATQPAGRCSPLSNHVATMASSVPGTLERVGIGGMRARGSGLHHRASHPDPAAGQRAWSRDLLRRSATHDRTAGSSPRRGVDPAIHSGLERQRRPGRRLGRPCAFSQRGTQIRVSTAAEQAEQLSAARPRPGRKGYRSAAGTKIGVNWQRAR